MRCDAMRSRSVLTILSLWKKEIKTLKNKLGYVCKSFLLSHWNKHCLSVRGEFRPGENEILRRPFGSRLNAGSFSRPDFSNSVLGFCAWGEDAYQPSLSGSAAAHGSS